MKISKIKLSNFGQYDSAEISFSSEDLILVTGEDVNNEKKSIGTGKSTLLESILFALYGKYKDGADSAMCVKMGKSEAIVVIEFDFCGASYTIIRKIALKKNNKSVQTLEVYKSGKLLNNGVTDGQKIINNIVGINYDLFVSVSFFIQGKADKFTSATPAKKLEHLSKLCNITNFDIARKCVGDDISILEREAYNLGTKRSISLNELSNYSDTNIDIQLANKEIAEMEGKISTLKDKNKEIEQSNLAFDKKKRLEFSRGYIASDLGSIRKEVKGKKDRTHIIKHELESIVKVKDESYSHDKIINLANDLSIIENKIVELRRVEASISELGEKIANFESSPIKTCDYCGSELGKEQAIKKITGLKEEKESKEFLKFTLGNFQRLNSEALEAREKLNKAKEQGEQAEQAKRAFLSKKTELELLEKQIKELCEREKSKALELAKIDEELLRYSNIIHVDSSEFVNQITRLVERRAKLKEEIQAQIRKDKMKAEVSCLDDKIVELEAKIQRLNAIKIGFSRHNIPKIIVQYALDNIEYYANEILSELLDNYAIRFNTEQTLKSGETAQTLEIVISDGNNERSLLSFSGGESALINFSIRLAISKFIVSGTSKSIGLVVLDEVFSSLGDYSTERVLKALTVLKKEFSQIFNITHKIELEEIFTHKIEIVANSGNSYIKGGAIK